MKRYEMTVDERGIVTPDKCVDGEWVRFFDHACALNASETRVRELELEREVHAEARRGYAERVGNLESELAQLRASYTRGSAATELARLRERVAKALRLIVVRSPWKDVQEALRGE